MDKTLDLIRIRIPKWERFNPRADRANHTWFRLENDFLEHRKVFHLSDVQIVLFLNLASIASKEGRPEFETRVSYLSALRKKKPAQIRNYLEILAASELIEVEYADAEPAESRQDDGKEPASRLTTLRNVTIRNERKEKESGEPARAAAPHVAPPVPVIPELSEPEFVAQELRSRGVKPALQKTWIDAYPDLAWVRSEIGKAITWEAANPHKRKKDFGRFMTNWLARGWDRSRAMLPSNPTSAPRRPVNPELTLDEIRERVAAEAAAAEAAEEVG